MALGKKKIHGDDHAPSESQIRLDAIAAAAWRRKHKVKKGPAVTADNAVSITPTAKRGSALFRNS